jgi:hypothetical protein
VGFVGCDLKKPECDTGVIEKFHISSCLNVDFMHIYGPSADSNSSLSCYFRLIN